MSAFNFKMRCALLIVLSAVSVTACVPLTYAQTFEESLSIEMVPPQPGAFVGVSVSLESSSLDINTAEIIWTVNGKVASRGRGVKTLNFETGALGSVTNVRVVVTTTNGQRVEKNFTIRPAEVDVIWEALTYAPALYRGKTLPTSNSKIKITAVPHVFLENGARVTADNLVFTWQRDRQVLGSLSGIGKQSIVIDGPLSFEKTRIAVYVSSISGLYSTQGGATIEGVNPQVVFYEKHPLLGVRYERALPAEFTLSAEEVTVRSEPYFFALEDVGRNRLNFSWSLNDSPAESSANINEIVLRKEESMGTARLSLLIKNTAKALQDAAANMLIRF